MQAFNPFEGGTGKIFFLFIIAVIAFGGWMFAKAKEYFWDNP